ncbi:MAG: asparagine synthetase B [Pseudomonadales bacterium]
MQLNPQIGDFAVLMSKGSLARDKTAEDLRWPHIYEKTDLRCENISRSDALRIFTAGGTRTTEDQSWVACGAYHAPSLSESADFHNWLCTALANNQSPLERSYKGKFCSVVCNPEQHLLVACTDYMRTMPLYYAELDQGIAVGTDIRLLASLINADEIDENAIYHYLNFACIPTPHTIFRSIKKIPTGSQLTFSNGKLSIERYWKPEYRGTGPQDEVLATEQLHDTICQSISSNAPVEGEDWGAFLSGGNDSSTICGVLAASNTDQQLKTFSIGFSEPGYDELPYARIASQAFGTQSHELTVSADDTFDVIPKLVAIYDEPFGNSSAIPTYFCSELAASNGVNTLIAGDGGDEIFGGNERYAKDSIFQRFYSLPGAIKYPMQLLAQGLSGVDSRFLNRYKNFVRRASLANPERFYTDDSFASDHFDTLLTPEFAARVNRESSLAIVDGHYQSCDSQAELDRLMFIDLQMAIADNDLSKVNRTAKASGVSVLYPYLSREIVDFTATLSPHFKVRGTDKRYLFKQAVEKILPLEIRQKRKQGFGLPVAVWFRENEKFKNLTREIVLSQRAMERGIFNTSELQNIVDRHQKGHWDYSEKIWKLLILELWLRDNVDA